MTITQYRNEVTARIIAKTGTGKTLDAANAVFDKWLSGGYSNGVNVVVEHMKLLIGLQYGDNDYDMDKGADCSQFVINELYFWFNIPASVLGSWTESLYSAEKDPSIPLTDVLPLMVILYNFKKGRHASHAAFVISATEIIHTRSTSKPLMISPLSYENDSIVKICDFITPEQRAFVTVQNAIVTPPVVPVETDTAEYYTVQRGDNLTSIAKRFNTTITDIMHLNPIIQIPNLIRVGWKLKIRDNAPVTYVIQRGDNLSGIARKFGTSVSELVRLNPIIKNPNVIRTGWTLLIKEGN